MKSNAAVFLTAILLSVYLPGCAPEPNWFPVKVIRISEEYANINTDITKRQLAEHGITFGTKFNIKFGEHRMQAHLGKTYSDVEKGEWIALIEEDGKLQLAISYGNAATDIGCKAGDVLYIESLAKAN